MTFADRIRERYPEGLTGIFITSGTRTTYALVQKRHDLDPGRIEDMEAYADFASELTRDLFATFFELGGQNLITTPLSYQRFSDDHGAEYTEIISGLCRTLMEDKWVEFYQRLNIDPYFVGIDTLLHSSEHKSYSLGLQCAEFNKNWTYKEGRRKLIWEIAPIPLYSIWKVHQVMGKAAQAQLETELSAAIDLQTIHDLLYRYYARAVYGTDLPMPHFYLGANRNGDLKLRSLFPIALLCGGPFRMFFTPYPSLFITRETLQAILEDLAFGKPLTSKKTDYSGQLTPELADQEYERIMELAADPRSTLGLIRQVQSDNED